MGGHTDKIRSAYPEGSFARLIFIDFFGKITEGIFKE